MRQLGSWCRACTKLREIAAISLHFPFRFQLCRTQTTHHSLPARLQVMKAQQGYQCLPVPPLGRVEVLPAPSCECWSSLPSWSNLRTQRLWVDKTGHNFASKRVFTLNTEIYSLWSTCTPVLLTAASDQGLSFFKILCSSDLFFSIFSNLLHYLKRNQNQNNSYNLVSY